MFSSKGRLDRKTGPDGVDRQHYLQELVDEFQSTETITEHKLQILANLANFAYDPVNYDFMRQLNIIDLFLDCLGEDESSYSTSEFESLTEFAVGGLCNLALDKQNKEYIIKCGGVQLLIKCLSSSNEETVLSTITGMMFLMSPASKQVQTSLFPQQNHAFCRKPAFLRFMVALCYKIRLLDCCSPSQVENARRAMKQWNEQHDTLSASTSAAANG